MNPPDTRRRRRGRWVLLALGALSLSGFVASFALIQSGWRPPATRNYGELVQPPRPIQEVALRDPTGATVSVRALHGKWTLVYFGPAECPAPCRDNLYKMRQVAAAQGLEAHRVQRVFVVTDPKPLDLVRHAIEDYPGTLVLGGAPEAVRELARQFALAAGTPLDGLHRLYVVDPLGNLMMSYPADADPRGINKDLKLLLRASQVG